MGDVGDDGCEFPHVSQGWYRAIVFCSDALNMEAATAAIGKECRANGPDWFRVRVEPHNRDSWSLEVQRRVVPGDEYGSNLLEIVTADPTKLSGGTFSAGVTYSHCWYIFGSEDPNMDYFNDWLSATQRVHSADPSSIWVDLASVQ
eukprot:g3248.t1